MASVRGCCLSVRRQDGRMSSLVGIPPPHSKWNSYTPTIRWNQHSVFVRIVKCICPGFQMYLSKIILAKCKMEFLYFDTKQNSYTSNICWNEHSIFLQIPNWICGTVTCQPSLRMSILQLVLSFWSPFC